MSSEKNQFRNLKRKFIDMHNSSTQSPEQLARTANLLKQLDMNTITDQCALTFGAGDDIGNVQLRDIDVFCGNITSTDTNPGSAVQGAYSDHASFVLNSLALGLENGDLILTDALSNQIQTILANHPDLDIQFDEDAAPRTDL